VTATTLLQRKSISLSDFRCSARPGETPFVEQHRCHSVSYVRKGSFGCRSRGLRSRADAEGGWRRDSCSTPVSTVMRAS
jgi:hypothetical protein